MEKFIQTEKVKIYMMQELFEHCIDTQFNLNPLLDESLHQRMNSFIANAIASEIDFLFDDPAMYKELYYPE
jgi:hypothetical protein